jgi:tetratricopeptide (TPR) repeat protein
MIMSNHAPPTCGIRSSEQRGSTSAPDDHEHFGDARQVSPPHEDPRSWIVAGGDGMTDQLIVDLTPDGRASVTARLEGDGLPVPAPTFELAWPLGEGALDDLRWYLEDYLVLPSGVYGERGQKVRERLAQWGADVFGAVFGSGPASDAYMRVRSRAAGTKLVFRSSSPQLLALPWELMRDPALLTPLALDLEGVSRGLHEVETAGAVSVPGGRLRVLMVIARPGGESDIGYQMIASPLLERLGAVRGEVDLVVLRPPTIEELARTLAEASAQGAPFQVVHFDGHGTHRDRWFSASDVSGRSAGQSGEGVLVFEKPGGGADEVSASAVARVLADAAVPVVVLNACQSGAMGKDLEAAIATRLLQEGTASVVAMAYSVYAVAAAEFMAAFYESLFAGEQVSAAVTAGRKRMALRNERPSRKGDMPLEDWMIPVHYMRRDVRFPQAVTQRGRPLSLDEELDQVGIIIGDGAGTSELDPVEAFIGRDWLTCQLEVAARLQRVVVLHGPGGTGKTELVKAFGRWWRDTGGVEDPGHVFFHSFEPGVATFGLDGVVNEIGRSLFGAEFDHREPAERQAMVEKSLAEHSTLLIWDNFETVRSMPAPGGVTRPLDEGGSRELRAFLGRLAANSMSSVLITSRSPEFWLGDVRRIAVGGLTPPEANRYAGHLLAPFPAARARQCMPAFGDLMEWLDGHPLSMRLILRHLETSEPAELLSALRGTAALPGTVEPDGGRTTSLPASIAYSYAHLPRQCRRLLPAISLLQSAAYAGLLSIFSDMPDVPERFRGVAFEQWRDTLLRASDVGLLAPPDKDAFYKIHPALPAYLAAKWREEDPRGCEEAKDNATRAMVTALRYFAEFLHEKIDSGKAGWALGAIDRLHQVFSAMLATAITREQWSEAFTIFNTLHAYWHARGLQDPGNAWAEKIRLAAEDSAGVPPESDSPSFELWLSAALANSQYQIDRFQLNQAETTSRKLLNRLEPLGQESDYRRHLPVVYGQLGNIAYRAERLDEAESWYRQTLDFREEPGMLAHYYDSLGLIAREQGKLEKAREFYNESLRISRASGDRRRSAHIYGELSSIALDYGQIDDAEAFADRALTLAEDSGDRNLVAEAYEQLGNIAEQSHRPADAEQLYCISLGILEETGYRPGMAQLYVNIGIAAHDQGHFGYAEAWFLKALSIQEEFGNTPHMATTLAGLGKVATDLRKFKEALEWYVRCVTLFGDFPHPLTSPGPEHLAQLTRTLGISALEEAWINVTGQPLPINVRDYMTR